jgi:hypothetical protein
MRDLILTATRDRTAGTHYELGAAAPGHRSHFPRRRFAGVGRSRPSGLHFGRGLAREVELDTANTSGYSRWLIRVRVGAPTAGAALALGGEGNSLTQRKKGGEKGTACSLPPQDTTTAARSRRLAAPGLNRDGAGADWRQRTLGSSDGTTTHGFGESWEV